jgi:uncharacterized ferritin-like protein (DUF455 family)
MELRHCALLALQSAEPKEKVQNVAKLWERKDQIPLDREIALFADPALIPGRPQRPELVHARNMPKRSAFHAQGLAALVHAVCHIEFNAINLALDAIWRFPQMPTRYYQDWLRVAYEESTHFEMLGEILMSMGYSYGDFTAHDGLWEMCSKTAHSVIARMALVPRTLEARGLDATPLIQQKLQAAGGPDALRACAALDIILRDEVGHVAIGNHWFNWLCRESGLDPLEHYAELALAYQAPQPRPPFNFSARHEAGFSGDELQALRDLK